VIRIAVNPKYSCNGSESEVNLGMQFVIMYVYEINTKCVRVCNQQNEDDSINTMRE